MARRIAGQAARRRAAEAAPESRDTQKAVEDEAPSEPYDAVEIDETDEDIEPAPDEGKEPGAPRSRLRLTAPPARTWRWLAPLLLVTIAAVVFAIVMANHVLSERSEAADLAAAREEASSAAATAAQEVLALDYESIDENKAAAENFLTDDFAPEHSELFSQDYCDVVAPGAGEECAVEGSYEEVVVENEQTLATSVVDVAALECGDDCDPDELKVLLFLDQQGTTGGKSADPTPSRAIFSMVKDDDTWLVDGISYL